MKEIAFEGIDNVGKTSVSTYIADKLRCEGKRVHVATPFHDTAVTGGELYDLFTESPTAAAKATSLLQEGIDKARTAAVSADADYLLFDRHWMTAKIMAPDLELEQGIKPATVLLISGTRDLRSMTDDEPWSTVEQLNAYQQAYKKLAACNFSTMLGVYVVENPPHDIAAVAETIMWDERILR